MFERLRTKIVLSFCLLIAAGGAGTTVLVHRHLRDALAESTDRTALALGRTLAAELIEPVAYADWLEVKRILVNTRRTSHDASYLFVAAPDSSVLEHSFARGRFPGDLLAIAKRNGHTMLRVEGGRIHDLPVPIADGILGTLHVGVSMGWAEETIRTAIGNVLITTALAMALGALGILFLTALITRPILALTETAKRLGEGDVPPAAAVTGRDEVAVLAATFNSMAVQIRERIEHSDQLRAYVERILDHLISGVIVVTADGVIEYANGVATDRYGPLVGRPWHESLATERPQLMSAVAEVLETGRVLTMPYGSASGRSYELTYAPILGRQGQRAVMEKSFDVTEQMELAASLQRTERLAATGEIAAGVVHAVNNPLDGMRRAIQLARTRPDDLQRMEKMLALVDEGCDRIAEVTHTLLGFARIEGEATPVRVAIGRVVQGAVELVRLKAGASEVTIRVDVPPALPDLFIDPEGIKEVLVNLLINAVDACEPEGTISLRVEEAGAEYVEILIIDDGEGVPPELVGRIFEPFFTTKDLEHGTGLGLSVARRIVETHGGEIRLEPTSGGGATFRIRLPISGESSAESGGQ